MNTFEQSIISDVTKKALKHIDVEEMAKELAPQLKQKIQEGLLQYIDDEFYFGDVFDQSSIRTAMNKIAKDAVLEAFKPLKGMTK